MSRLLVRVRNAEEAQVAIAEGVDLIDIKEPDRGSLGAADVKTIRAIVEQVDRRVPLSAALGELIEPLRLPLPLARELRYAKIGLAGCARLPDWQDRWSREIERLPPGVTPVAVAYADAKSARAPAAATILQFARQAGCGAILLDTCDKTAGSLLDCMAISELARFVDAARQRGLTCVLAGGLTLQEIPKVSSLDPDYIALRGAVCTAGRAGRLDVRRLRRIVTALGAGARRPRRLGGAISS